MKKNLFVWVLTVVVIFSACKKDDVNTPAPITPAKGIYVLSEGPFGGNATKLGYRDAATGTYSADFFLQQNPALTAGLGDLGNDMIIYGGKMYIVMNGSGNVTVLNAANAKFMSQISFGGDGAGNKSPRFAVGTRGKVFVTSYDNTVSIIDTTTLAITGSIPVGTNPEGIATAGNYLYVANSGGLNFPDVADSTVSVIDLGTLTEIKKIRVGLNPQKIEVSAAGKVYVTAYGDFGVTTPSFVAVINSATNLLETTLGDDYQYDHIRIFNDIAYFYNNYGSNAVKVYNTTTNTLVRNSFVTDGTAFTSTYGVNIDEQNGDVYITDAKDNVAAGEVTCFTSAGVKKFSFSTTPGVNPNKVLFVR